MKKINNFQSWLFKPVVSAIVFLSLIVIGGVAIIARNSNPSSLPSLKSGANSQKLTAQNWDALVDYVAGMDADVQSKLGDINQKIIQISGSIINNNGNGTPTTNTGGIWDKNGSNIYYNAGNVGIGINNPTAKLQVNGNVIASNPTANNHVATKEYVDNHKPTIKDYVLIQIKVGISKQNVATDNYDTCFVTGIMDGGWDNKAPHNAHSNIQSRTTARRSSSRAMTLDRNADMSAILEKTDFDDNADDSRSCWVNRSSYNWKPSELVAIVSRGDDDLACQFTCLKF